jgi:hypothetical protein
LLNKSKTPCKEEKKEEEEERVTLLGYHFMWCDGLRIEREPPPILDYDFANMDGLQSLTKVGCNSEECISWAILFLCNIN